MSMHVIFVALALVAAPGIAQPPTAPAGALLDQMQDPMRDGAGRRGKAKPAKPTDVVAGKQVRDAAGALLGTVSSVDAINAFVSSARGRVRVPISSFRTDEDGLVLELDRSRFDAMIGTGATS